MGILPAPDGIIIPMRVGLLSRVHREIFPTQCANVEPIGGYAGGEIQATSFRGHIATTAHWATSIGNSSVT
jgi:hypothetical protein